MMKKALLVLVAVAGYVGYSYYSRTRGEVALHREVKELLTKVPCNARGLSQSQVRELEDLLLGHGFKLKPDSMRLSTARSKDRPLGETLNQNEFANHVFLYAYERPAFLLPFNVEVHEARETQLVEIPGSAPSLTGPGSSANSYQSNLVRQQNAYSQTQQQRAQAAMPRPPTSSDIQKMSADAQARMQKDWEKTNDDLRKRLEKERKKREKEAKKKARDAKKKKHKSATRRKNE